jgi:hypothetical protein
MSTFSSLIPAVAVTPSPRALAVVLLDRAGVDPDAIKSGVTVIGCSGDVVDFVADTVDHLVFGGQSDTPTWEAPSAEAQSHILSGDVHDDKFVRAIAFGKPVVVVARPSRLPDGADIQADRRYDVTSSLTDDVIADVVRLVTRDAVDCAGLADAIGMNALIGTARSNLSGGLVVERLRALAEKKAADDAAAKKEAQEKASADREASKVAPVADAGAPVVTRLRDLSGYGDAKAWGLQLASDIADYRAGRIGWADVDKGVILTSPPGCGKSYFAGALAAECGVTLIPTTYSDWHGGSSSGDTVAKSLGRLFAEWRKKAASGVVIVFWDEIDSIGKRGVYDRADYWYGPIINGWLAFLDGAESRTNIIVVAATNFPDKVDDALKRPGRLEKVVEIPRPGIEDLKGIIAHQLAAPSDPELLAMAARACRGRTPAQIAMLCREARRLARKRGMGVTPLVVIEAANADRPRRDGDLDWSYCLHEAAHAVINLAVGLNVQYVDADAGECCVAVEPLLTRAQIEAHIVGTLAARRADAMIGSGVHSGAVSDLANATALARRAVAQFGLGLGVYFHSDREAELLPDVRGDVMELLETLDIRAARLVDSHREAIIGVAEALRERRYLDAQEVDQVIVDTLKAHCA